MWFRVQLAVEPQTDLPVYRKTFPDLDVALQAGVITLLSLVGVLQLGSCSWLTATCSLALRWVSSAI